MDRGFQNQESRNDVSWYSRNPSLLAAAASIPFPYRPGMSPQVVNKPESVTASVYNAIPGILTIDWYPTVGYSQSATDAASIVGKEIFAKVREKFSGSIDADAPDFVIYLMALDSIFSYIGSLKRVYRILTAYTSENHYIPDALLQALGFSTDSIINLKEHRMQFYQIINELVFMTRKFNLPAAFDIINRHYWLNDNVYMDADSINSQFYVFNCQRYYKFGLSATADGIQVGSLNMQALSIPTTEVSEYLFQFGRSMIDALAGSDDAYIISGYLMRAYEGVPVFSVDELMMDEKLIPHYDPEVLMQIENSLPLPVNPKWDTGVVITNDVTQDPGTNSVLCNPHIVATIPGSYSENGWIVSPYLSIRSDNPTAADVTIATRMKMGRLNDKSTNKQLDYDISCASEIVTGMTVYYYEATVGTNQLSLQNSVLRGLIVLGTDANSMAIVRSLNVLQSFDWHPILPVLTPAVVDGVYVTNISGDVHNFTVLTDEQLYQINRVCLYSEFNAYGML